MKFVLIVIELLTLNVLALEHCMHAPAGIPDDGHARICAARAGAPHAQIAGSAGPGF